MEKTSYTILEEMRQAVAALRSQLDSIEAQMTALESAVEAEVSDNESVAEVEAAPFVAVEAVAEQEKEAAQDACEEPVAEVSADIQEAVATPEPAPEPAPVSVSEPAAEQVAAPAAAEPVAETPAVEEVPADTLVMEEAPEPIDLGISDFNLGDIELPAANINDAEAVNVKPAVMDVMAEKCAWKTDMPGTPVKNVLSAISLNDRILFVKALFGEDAALFQQTIQIFNACGTLAEAEDYIRTNFRNWDMNSDVVYRFMMAVRRKLK